MKNVIPIMDDPLSSAWLQPEKENILIDANFALMTNKDFKELAEYSTSIPSAVYPGKMWKAKADHWLLRWYDEEINGRCVIESREIIIV
jgi:hypothetical protein